MTNSSQVAARELEVQPICTFSPNGKEKKKTASSFQMNLCQNSSPATDGIKVPWDKNTTPLIPNKKKWSIRLNTEKKRSSWQGARNHTRDSWHASLQGKVFTWRKFFRTWQNWERIRVLGEGRMGAGRVTQCEEEESQKWIWATPNNN